MKQFILTIVFMLPTSVLAAEPLSPAQQEVWAGEVAYWNYVNSNDVAGFLTLWEQDFIGWPCGASKTENYNDLRLVAAEWFSEVSSIGNETTIEPDAIIVDDQFAITYLAATTMGPEQKEVIKLTHTWRRTDDGWKIIGGMCGPLER